MATEKRSSRIIFFCFMTLLALPGAVCAAGAQLSLVPERSENSASIALVIDHAEKIAGMKVTITYDSSLLSFIKAEKSKATASFMHVVNDKHPGKIIIVMASAKGVSGNDLPLVYLEFSVRKAATGKARIVGVSQVQLMDENLKEIAGNKPEYRF